MFNPSFRTRGPFVELDAKDVERALAVTAMGGFHVAHFVIDGGIRGPGHTERADTPDTTLDPDAIAQTYLHVMGQPRSAWTWEVELRLWTEKF